MPSYITMIADCFPVTCARLTHWLNLLSDQNLDLYSTSDIFFWILPYYLARLPFTRDPVSDIWDELTGPLLYMSWANWVWTTEWHLWNQPGVVWKICGLIDVLLEGVLTLSGCLLMWLALDLIVMLAYRSNYLRALVALIQQAIQEN
ncbi:MAG: hypothetical protein Q9216_006547 [Gyalolechia sp. 2 TL-2023]